MRVRRSFTLSHLIATARFAIEAFCSGSLPRYGGKYSQKFSSSLTSFSGSKHAIPVSSGTAAIFIMLQAIKQRGKNCVAIPRFTDPGVLNSCDLLGIRFGIISGKQDGYPFDSEDLRRYLSENPQTDTLLYTHVGGYLQPDISEIIDLCASKNILLLEDASQGFGYKDNNYTIGRFGELAAISMMGSKLVVSGTQGGAVLVNNDSFFPEVKLLVDRGKTMLEDNRRDYVRKGLNFNLCEFSCCLGIVSLHQASDVILKRQQIASRIGYHCSGFKKLKLITDQTSAYWFVIGRIVDERAVKYVEKNEFLEYPYLGDIFTFESFLRLHGIPREKKISNLFVIRIHESMHRSEVNKIIAALNLIETEAR